MLQETPNIVALSGRVVALGRGARRGSGLVVGQDRVVTLSQPLFADRVETLLGDGRNREARVIGVDRAVGVAVLDVETGDATPVTWAESTPAIGTTVFALGNPGTGLRFTEGRISADPLTIRSRHGRPVEVIEHTAPMPTGAGGGPLVDELGSVIGLNALRGDAGFLLALPATTVRGAIDRALAGREPVRLGVALASPRAGQRIRSAVGLPHRDGLLVRAVEDGSPAELAGVLAGDLLVRLGDIDLKTVDDLYAALDAAVPGQSVSLRVVRPTEECDLDVDLVGGGP
jgi:serine protease Do